jgi:DNA polymerase-1
MKINQRQIDEDICRKVIESKSIEDLIRARDFINQVQKYKKVSKLYSTYYKGIKKAVDYNGENKVYVDFKFDGTTTGRLSCSRYYKMGVSFHTLPRKTKELNIREIFNSLKWLFITTDYSGMELRVLAHVCKDKQMINAIRSGVDLHIYTASLIFEKPIEKITKEERQIAKSVSFLIVYGGGAGRLASEVNISIQRAQSIINRYMEVYPGIFTWMDETREFLHEHQYVTSLFGGRRNLPDIKSPIKKVREHAERQGINFKIQRPASDILLYCLMDIHDEFELRGLDSLILATVHDSAENESPRPELEEALNIIYDKMINYPSLRKIYGFECEVPFNIEVVVGRAFDVGTEVKYVNGKVSNLQEILNEN